MNRLPLFPGHLSLLLAFGLNAGITQAQVPVFTRADTLRGSLNPERTYDVQRYDISIRPDFAGRSVTGSTVITYLDPPTPAGESGARILQIDLQEPLVVDSMVQDGKLLSYAREGNLFHVNVPPPTANALTCRNCPRKITVAYHGLPRVAVKPPWDGGWIFSRDSLGRPWMTVACEGLGASVWFPCKDYLGDEPDSGVSLHITVPDTLTAVGNGRLQEKKSNGDGTTTWTWIVRSPINSYDIIPYIGKYKSWTSVFPGEKGPLDCSYFTLDYHLAVGRTQFRGVDSMLRCFEHWFGPYPFYEDGYKIVEAPHLGMEHQSDIAYGNHFLRGYAGHDLSGTGWGMKWDFIVVHESGHEWFGNNITAKDLADEWIHESFTNYSETLYTGYYFGAAAGDAYNIGTRKNIENKNPIIGYYGVNEGPKGTDEYYKGGNMLHTIRQVMRNDSLFRQVLRGLNQVFYHQTVTADSLESVFSRLAGRNFKPVFDQYLRDTRIPVLEYKTSGKSLLYRWADVVPGFDMPVRITGAGEYWLYPTADWQTLTAPLARGNTLQPDARFYITTRNLGAAGSVKTN